MMKLKSNDVNKFFWNTLGTVLNAFNSLFYLVIITRLNGIESAGVFSFAFSVSSIFYIVAVYAGRTFQVTEKDESISDNDFLATRFLNILIMIVAAIIFASLGHYTSEQLILFALLTVFRSLEAFSDVMYGIIQKKERLDIVGKSLFFKAIISTVVFIVVDLLTHNLVVTVLTIPVVYFIGFIFVDLRFGLKLRDGLSLKKTNILVLLKAGFFTFIFTVLSLYVVNSPRFAIEKFMDSSAQAIFSYVFMPSTVMVIFGQFLCQPYLVRMSTCVSNQDRSSFNKIVFTLIGLIGGAGLLALIAAYFLGIPVLQLIYGVNLTEYRVSLLVIIAGATLYTLTTVFSNALITMRRTKSQVFIYIASSLIIMFLSNYFVEFYGVLGGVLSYSITMLIQFAIYLTVYLLSIRTVFTKKKMLGE